MTGPMMDKTDNVNEMDSLLVIDMVAPSTIDTEANLRKNKWKCFENTRPMCENVIKNLLGVCNDGYG